MEFLFHELSSAVLASKFRKWAENSMSHIKAPRPQGAGLLPGSTIALSEGGQTPNFSPGTALAIAAGCVYYPGLPSERSKFVHSPYTGTNCASPVVAPIPQKPKRPNKRQQLKAQRAPYKSECKAQLLLRDLIGFEQWKVYRRTNRVIVIGKHSWIIGNVFGDYHRSQPFLAKPDVVRLDGVRRWRGHYPSTSFCFLDRCNEPIPYTDKVYALVMNLINDEKEFLRTGNRIREQKLKTVPESAVYSVDKC